MANFVEYLGIAVAVVLVIYSIILHEIAHGYAAYRLGDPTAALLGRLSLNPIRHIDPLQTIIVPALILWASKGQFLFGGAKPVPIDPYKFRNVGKGMLITGIAGPTVNLTIMVACALLLRFCLLFGTLVSTDIVIVLFRVGYWNMILLVFNMVPIPPLDGSRVLRYFLPRDVPRSYDSIEPYGIFIVVIAVFSGYLHPLFKYGAWVYGVIAGLA